MNALSASDILTKDEVKLVQDSLRKGRKRQNIRQNEIIFRLATCCGLRVSEMCKLVISDLTLTGPRPSIRVQKKNVKGKTRMRTVPLWWDAGNLEVLIDWVKHRKAMGAKPSDPLLCTMRTGTSPALHCYRQEGRPLRRDEAAKRWKAAIRVLGAERRRQVSVHCGRHTFASHAIAAGRTIVEVQQALGHSELAATSVYMHLVANDSAKQLYT